MAALRSFQEGLILLLMSERRKQCLIVKRSDNACVLLFGETKDELPPGRLHLANYFGRYLLIVSKAP